MLCSFHCSLGETCSHVAALLYKIEAAVRLGYTASACTDEPCKWNSSFCKEVKPVPLSKINFYKEKVKEKRPRRSSAIEPSPATVTERDELLRMLAKACPKAVGLSLFAEYGERFITTNPVPPTSISGFTYPDSLRSLYQPQYEDMAVSDLQQVPLANVQLSNQDIDQVEKATRTQSSCSLWYELREGRITASVAHECLRTKPDFPAASIIKKICFKNLHVPETHPNTLSARAWGQKHEHDAFVMYEAHMTGKLLLSTNKKLGPHKGQHDNCVVTKSGFIIKNDNQCFGASPDGIVECECCGKGGIEIKCPFMCAKVSIEEKVQSGEFYLNTSYQLAKGHKYYTQVQFQMYVLDLQHVDFVVWSPQDHVIIRVARDEEFIVSTVDKLKLLWKNHILPELLSRRFERANNSQPDPAPSTSSQPEPEPSTSEEKKTKYCVCGTTTDLENMVGCDRCNNWFHLKCIKLKRFPRTKTWYCKPCRQKRSKKE